MATMEDLFHQAQMRMAGSGGEDGNRELGQAAKELRQAAAATEGNARMEGQAAVQNAQAIESLTMQLNQLLMEMRQSRIMQQQAMIQPPLAPQPLPPPPGPSQIPYGNQLAMQAANIGSSMSQGATIAGGSVMMAGGGAFSGLGIGLGAAAGGLGYGSNVLQDMAAQNVARLVDDRMYSPNPGGYTIGPQRGMVGSFVSGMFGTGMMRDHQMHEDRVRAMSHQTAINAGAAMTKMTQMGLGMFTGRGLGGNIGTAVGGAMGGLPGSMIGGYVGGAVGGAADVVNPVAWGSEQLGNIMQGAGVAQALSADMLRGGNSNRMSNSMAIGIGRSINRVALDDVDFRQNEIMDITARLGQAGFFRGTSDEKEFEQKLRKELSSLKGIMKTMRLARDEAIKVMVEIQSDMGFSTPQGRMMQANLMYGAAQMAGVSTRTAVEFAKSSSQSFAGAGMMASTGARLAPGAMALGGMATAYGGVDSRLLASVGGQRGLSSLINNSQSAYLQGNLGTLMAAGGPFQDISAGMSGAASSLGTGTGMLDFMANRHRRIDQMTERMGPQGVMASQAMQLSNMADRMGFSHPDDKKNAMQMLAVQMGLAKNPQEAEALVSSYASIPSTMNRQLRLAGERQADLERDRALSHGGIMGRLKRSFRQSMSRGEIPVIGSALSSFNQSFVPTGVDGMALSLGGRALEGAINGIPGVIAAAITPDAYRRAKGRGGGMTNWYEEVSKSIGQSMDSVERWMGEQRDNMAGVQRDTLLNEDLNHIQKKYALSKDFGKRERKAGVPGGVKLQRNTAYVMSTGAGGAMRKVIEAASKKGASPAARRRLGKVVAAMKKGVTLRSIEEIDAYDGSATAQEVQTVVGAAGLGSPEVDRELRKAFGGTREADMPTESDRDDIVKSLTAMSFQKGGMNNADILAAMGDEDVESMRSLIGRWIRAYDGNAIGGGEKAQELARQITSMRDQIKADPNKPDYVKQFIDQMFTSAGLQANGDGTLNPSDMRLIQSKEGPVMQRSGFMNSSMSENFGTYFLDDSRTDRDRKLASNFRKARGEGVAFDKGASVIAGTFGLGKVDTVGSGASKEAITSKSREIADKLIGLAMTKTGQKKLAAIVKKGGPMAEYAHAALRTGFMASGDERFQGEAGMSTDDFYELTTNKIMTGGAAISGGQNVTGGGAASGDDSEALLTRKAQLDYMRQNTATMAAIARAINPDAAIPTGG